MFVSIACLFLLCWVAAAVEATHIPFQEQDALEVDVCVIGGGAGGTYAAIKSLDLNKTVIVVEKQDRLGGHTKTYVDPISKQPIELGVAEWENTTIVRNFIARFGIPLYKYNFTLPGVTSEYVDFQTGKIASPKSTNVTNGWDLFQAQVAKYPFLDYSLDSVPFPVPPDLLLPFGQFIEKYNLQAAVPYLSLYGQGWGNFVTLPTLLAIKFFPPDFYSPASLQGTGSGALAAKDNSLLYEAAQKELGNSVLLNSTVLSMNRTAADYARITVQTPSGVQHIRAKKIISAIPPILENLKGFDLNATEVPIFNKFRYHGWYVGLLNNSGIPNNLTIFNYGTNNAQNYDIVVLPAAYDFFATPVPGLHYFTFGLNDSELTFTQSQVLANMEASLARMRAVGTLSKTQSGAAVPNIIDFTSHTPYEVYVSSDEIKKGFYNKLFALQGQRNTYWTGAAFVTHSSAAIWNYTDQLVDGMWKENSESVGLSSALGDQSFG